MVYNRYIIKAKILGKFLPDKSFRIGKCVIKKDPTAHALEIDKTELPIRNRSIEFYLLEHGIRNFITFSQTPISTRNFESDYIITTEVRTTSLHYAIKEAKYRFMGVTSALTLAVRGSTYKVGNGRSKMTDQFYDFEIVAIFMRHGKTFERIRLPDPLTSGLNFFPKDITPKIKTISKKYHEFNEPIFNKAMIYLQRSLSTRGTELYSSLETSLNLIKLIELISKNTNKKLRFGLTKKVYSGLKTKKLFEHAGVFLKVTKKNIKNAQKAWDERNKNDIGHQTEHYNIYERERGEFVDQISLEAAATDYLKKYFDYYSSHQDENPFRWIKKNT